MYEITQRTLAPYSSICYISCEWADGTMSRASGVIVGLNDVLTAHHVVYDAYRGGYATRITVSPAADTSPYFIQPYGSFSDVEVIYGRTANWDSNGDQMLFDYEAQYDMALLGMGSAIGGFDGVNSWLPVSNTAMDFSGRIVGYPAAGSGMMEQPVFADASTQAGVFDVAYSLGAGASGGPLLMGNQVVGVLSSGSAYESTYAGLFAPGTWDWLQNALAADNVALPGGQAPANVLVSPAAAGVITYMGSAFADSVLGTAANEFFRSSGGNDFIDGSAGFDTLTYGATRTTYVMGNAGAAFTVSDKRAGLDGSDGLTGVERVTFTDMTVNLEIGDSAQAIAPWQLKSLQELYVAFFNRVPDADGLNFWIRQTAAGQPINATADTFYSAALLYPVTGYSSAMTPTEFVDVIYRNVLGRTAGADAEGSAFWSGRLASGEDTRGSLVTTILYSAHTFKGDATWGWVADLLDNKAAVAQRFAVDLGLNYNTPEASVVQGMQIAAAVTPTDTAAALSLIGIWDNFATWA